MWHNWHVEVKGHKIGPNAQLAGVDLAHGALQGVNLENANLSGANLSGALMNGANLTNANLAGANLSGANLQGAILESANLSGANLTDAFVGAILHFENPEDVGPVLDVTKGKLIRVNLADSDLTCANLTRANLNSADLTRAKLSGAIFEETQLQTAIFRSADLSGVNLVGKDLKFGDFTGANLTHARLTNSNLQGAVLRGVDAASVNLDGANLKNADCSNANLQKASVSGSKISQTNFQSANLEEANFAGSLVVSANFKGARLGDAKFEGTKFTLVDFTGASGVEPSFIEEAGRILSRKTKKVLGTVLLLAVVLAFVVAVFQIVEARRLEQAKGEASVLADKFCDDIKSSVGEQSIEDSYQRFEQDVQSIENLSSSATFDYKRIAFRCRSDALEKFTPKSIPTPASKSDAELAAEGRSCSQQWSRARSETLSGSSNDVQLRATVYACEAASEWVLGAIDNGEYSDFLLDVICAVERRAPSCQ